jgi:hypothetical protein
VSKQYAAEILHHICRRDLVLFHYNKIFVFYCLLYEFVILNKMLLSSLFCVSYTVYIIQMRQLCMATWKLWNPYPVRRTIPGLHLQYWRQLGISNEFHSSLLFAAPIESPEHIARVALLHEIRSTMTRWLILCNQYISDYVAPTSKIVW